MPAQPALRLAGDRTKPKPNRRAAFNKTALENVQTPHTGETAIADDKVKGLVFRVRPSGARAFYLVKRHLGRLNRLKLGGYPTMSVEQARKAALAALHDLQAGKNPADARRAQRGELTVGGLWALYCREHLVARCSPRTARQETYLFDRHLKIVKGRKLGDLSPAACKQLHAGIGGASRTSANRAIQLLRRLYRYAARHHGYGGRIPTAGVELFREHSRERFLSTDELPRFLAACDAEGQPWADFFRLCIFIGARRSNVQAMRWACIDLGGRKWTIPGDETKNGRDTAVPLTGPALEILDRRKAEQALSEHERIRSSEYVFPPLRDKGETRYLSQPSRPFSRICRRARIEGLTIHDLRRTAGAWLAASGASLPMIGKALGHADLRATQIYARLDLDPVRAAMEGAALRMNGGAKP